MKLYINKIYSLISNKFYFKLLYLFVSLSFATPLNNLFIIKILSKFCIIWGVFIAVSSLFEYIFNKNKIYYFQIFLYAFLLLTLLFNIFRYPTMENLKIWLVNLIILISIFSIDYSKSKKLLTKELNVISYFYTLSTFILSLVSMIIIFTGKSIEITTTGSNGITRTVMYTGLFANENSLGLAAAISFIISIYIIVITSSSKVRFFYYFNAILQLITVIMSNGRSALLLIVSLIFIFIFMKAKKIWIRLPMLLTPLLCIPFLFKLSDSLLHYIFTGREYIWQAAWPIIKFFPFIGIGNSNKVSTLIANQKHELRGVEYGGLHNIYIEIATVNGLIALSLILLFIICIFFFLTKKIDNLNNRNEKFAYSILLTLVFGIPVVNLMESSLLYIISFISMIFWIYAGYLVSILGKRN